MFLYRRVITGKERAPRYDKENVWPAEDYAALKEEDTLVAARAKRVRRIRAIS